MVIVVYGIYVKGCSLIKLKMLFAEVVSSGSVSSFGENCSHRACAKALLLSFLVYTGPSLHCSGVNSVFEVAFSALVIFQRLPSLVLICSVVACHEFSLVICFLRQISSISGRPYS